MLDQRFYWGTTRKAIVAFGNMFNSITIDRKDADGNSAETFDVPDRSFSVGNASQGLSNTAGNIIDNFDFPLGEIEI